MGEKICVLLSTLLKAYDCRDQKPLIGVGEAESIVVLLNKHGVKLLSKYLLICLYSLTSDILSLEQLKFLFSKIVIDN